MKLRLVAMFFLCSSVCWGWNCTSPGQVRVQVPNGTIGSGTGDGSGQVVVDNGLTFECETLPSSTPSTGSNTNSSTNSNSNTNANTNTVNVHNNLSSTNTLSQKQQQSQSQTATGGAASSTSNATGGTSSANATGNGDGSNNTTTNVAASKIPVAEAYAPSAFPSAPCVKSYGGGVQTMAIGGSFGAGKIDEGCDIRETARSLALLGSRVAACKVAIREKQARKAGVTLEDCLKVPTPAVVVIKEVPAEPVVPVIQPVTITVPVTIINPLPAPPQYRTTMDVVAPKRKPVVHHLTPVCQNGLELKCVAPNHQGK
jgi:hypothetical protein